MESGAAADAALVVVAICLSTSNRIQHSLYLMDYLCFPSSAAATTTAPPMIKIKIIFVIKAIVHGV